MFSEIFEKIEEWLKGILIGMIDSNLSGMFTDVNSRTVDLTQQISQTPSEWNSSIFNMVQGLSETVIIPIAGMIITAVLCYELISMVTDKNSMHEVETWMFFRYIVKMWIAVWILSHTFSITMAVFDLGQNLAEKAGAAISGSTALDISGVITQIDAKLEAMDIGPLITLALETLLAKLGLAILSIAITIVVYGRMVEIYLYSSIAPVPFATVGNREWGQIGTNYFRAIIALAFQAFLMMICIGIFAAMVTGIQVTDDLRAYIFQMIICTAVLFYSLLKTGSFSKSIFNAH